MVLHWLEPFCAFHVFGTELEDEINPIISEMLSRALDAQDVYPALRQGARELRRVNEEAKMRKGNCFGEMQRGCEPET